MKETKQEYDLSKLTDEQRELVLTESLLLKAAKILRKWISENTKSYGNEDFKEKFDALLDIDNHLEVIETLKENFCKIN